MVLDSFMESYKSNVVVKGSDADMRSFFEGVTPCSYEDAIETFFEAQYSVEAMAAITESAILMEGAGAIETINEGFVGSFFNAAWEKIKDCATKVKQFAVACIKKITDFFKELYNKATPIDKAMQLYGKKSVKHSDIKVAMANGFKIPGSLKLLVTDPENQFDIIMSEFSINNNDIDKVIKETLRTFKQLGKTKEAAEAIMDECKEELIKTKESDKERFTWVGRLLSDNEEFSKKTMKGKFIKTANADKSKDGDISPQEWSVLEDYALNGQSKQRKYKSEIESCAKECTKYLDAIMKEVKETADNKLKNADDENKSTVAEENAARTKMLSTLINIGTYASNRSIMVMNKVILPIMRKMHHVAIPSYLYILNGTKSANKKADKKAGIK